jgi:hypothetical protein
MAASKLQIAGLFMLSGVIQKPTVAFGRGKPASTKFKLLNTAARLPDLSKGLADETSCRNHTLYCFSKTDRDSLLSQSVFADKWSYHWG